MKVHVIKTDLFLRLLFFFFLFFWKSFRVEDDLERLVGRAQQRTRVLGQLQIFLMEKRMVMSLNNTHSFKLQLQENKELMP